MKLLVTVDRDEDGVWVAECPAIPGCVSQGGAAEEAVECIRAAIVLCLEVRAATGLPLTMETRQIEVATWTPPLPALRGREVVRVLVVAKGTPQSLIRAANVTVEELLAARQARSRPATAPDPRTRSRQRSRTNVLQAVVPTRTMLPGATKEELLLMPSFVPNGRSTSPGTASR